MTLTKQQEEILQSSQDQNQNLGEYICNWFKGIYSLTLCKFTNPEKYKLAWKYFNKINKEENE